MMVQAVICTQDWIHPKKDEQERIDVEEILEELEQLEKDMFLILILFFSMSYYLEINSSCFIIYFFGYLVIQFKNLENSSLNGDKSEIVFCLMQRKRW